MRALFDVNVLIALFQPNHLHHDTVHQWWTEYKRYGWASCPITENGFVRIVSQPKYPLPQSVTSAVKLLAMSQQNTDHEFWPDAISLLDAGTVFAEQLTNHAQVTDCYLLALAVHQKGRLVTLDQSIRVDSIAQFKDENLIVL